MTSLDLKKKAANANLSLTVLHLQTWKDTLLRLIEGEGPIYLDLSGPEDCDTAGIQILISANTAAAELGKHLVLVNPGAPVRTAATRLGIVLEESFQITEQLNPHGRTEA